MNNDPLGQMQKYCDQRDWDSLWREWLSFPFPAHPSAAFVRAFLQILISRIVAAAPDRRIALFQEGTTSLRMRLAAWPPPGAEHVVADLCFAAGSLQEGLELARHAYRQAMGNLALAHRLGLGELHRAMTSPTHDADTSASRWRRALAFLTAAIYDRNYWCTWSQERSNIYAHEMTVEQHEDGRLHTFAHLRTMLGSFQEKAQKAGHSNASQSLAKLAAELEYDRAPIRLFGQAIEAVRASKEYAPWPFGMLWYDVMEGPTSARSALGTIIQKTLASPLPETEPDGTPPPHRPTMGVVLRQWYSRLAPVRHFLNQGQIEQAERALSQICAKTDVCRANPRTSLTVVATSPRCCDPQCDQFSVCNPGYAELPHPAKAQEVDAHHLAIQVCLARAGVLASYRPPRLIEAAQAWIAGRSLAGVVGELEAYQEQVSGQILGLLEDFRREPEHAASLLERGLAAVPSPTLKGRLSDQLTDRGITRCNDDRWEEGTQDLRWAVQLNRHAVRAQYNLSLALRNLAISQFNANRVDAALETLDELLQRVSERKRQDGDASKWDELVTFAEESAVRWKGLATKKRDANSLLAELNRMANPDEAS